MCPHPLASLDCALTHALLALPGALAAAVFALSALLWLGRASRMTARRALALAGVLPSSFVASALVSTVFFWLGVFRARTDPSLIFLSMLALTLALEALYVAAVRGPALPGPDAAPARRRTPAS